METSIKPMTGRKDGHSASVAQLDERQPTKLEICRFDSCPGPQYGHRAGTQAALLKLLSRFRLPGWPPAFRSGAAAIAERRMPGGSLSGLTRTVGIGTLDHRASLAGRNSGAGRRGLPRQNAGSDHPLWDGAR